MDVAAILALPHHVRLWLTHRSTRERDVRSLGHDDIRTRLVGQDLRWLHDFDVPDLGQHGHRIDLRVIMNRQTGMMMQATACVRMRVVMSSTHMCMCVSFGVRAGCTFGPESMERVIPKDERWCHQLSGQKRRETKVSARTLQHDYDSSGKRDGSSQRHRELGGREDIVMRMSGRERETEMRLLLHMRNSNQRLGLFVSPAEERL